jgi:hypothetical protein
VAAKKSGAPRKFMGEAFFAPLRAGWGVLGEK